MIEGASSLNNHETTGLNVDPRRAEDAAARAARGPQGGAAAVEQPASTAPGDSVEISAAGEAAAQSGRGRRLSAQLNGPGGPSSTALNNQLNGPGNALNAQLNGPGNALNAQLNGPGNGRFARQASLNENLNAPGDSTTLNAQLNSPGEATPATQTETTQLNGPGNALNAQLNGPGRGPSERALNNQLNGPGNSLNAQLNGPGNSNGNFAREAGLRESLNAPGDSTTLNEQLNAPSDESFTRTLNATSDSQSVQAAEEQQLSDEVAGIAAFQIQSNPQLAGAAQSNLDPSRVLALI